MSLQEITTAMRAQGGKALVPFFTAGYPDEETFVRVLVAAAEEGCRVIEVGIPFSDPMADGPVIQASSQRALEQGMTLGRALELMERATAQASAGLVVMSYLNPILRMGVGAFAERAARAGVRGVILPDVPVEEAGKLQADLARCGIALVHLVAPTSGDERIAAIARTGAGFLYLVSLTGVTGVRAQVSTGLDAFIGRVRAATDLPLYVGFGVSTPTQAAEVARWADGVIIGSALVRLLDQAPDGDEAVASVRRFLADVRRAMHGGGSGEDV